MKRSSSSKLGKPWFCRDSVAPELSGIATKEGVSATGRKVLFKDGEDLRLKQPGLDWSVLNKRRHKLTDEFEVELTGIFEKYLSKITARSACNVAPDSVPVLPSAKTPRIKSRILHLCECEPQSPINKPPLVDEPPPANNSPSPVRRTRAAVKKRAVAHLNIISEECSPKRPTVVATEPTTPSDESGPDAGAVLSQAKPTPPRRKALQLRKKGVKKTGRLKTRAAQLRVEAEVLPGAVVSSQQLVNVSLPATPDIVKPLKCLSLSPQPILVQTTPTPEDVSTPILVQTTPALEDDRTPIPKASDEEVFSTPVAGSPPKCSPLPTPAIPLNTFTDSDIEPPKRPAPDITPSYLTATPKTLLKLRQEYQSRSGGKVVSLSELRSIGRCSPANKHTKLPLKKRVKISAAMLSSSSLVSVKVSPYLGKRGRAMEEERETEENDSQSPIGTSEDSTDTSESGVDIPTQSTYTFMGVGGVLTKPLVNGLRKEGTNQPLSFLPRKSPKKLESIAEKKAQLASKLLRKNEEEKKRQESLKNRRQQEIMERKRKREEREKRVAEKQAVLRQEEEQKKQRIKGQQSQDQTKMVTIKKAKEVEEKNKKLKERMMAAEARRRQEEETQKKRLQQLEEERKMALDLAMQRKELEEEERRLKREKVKQERERYLKRIEEQREQQEEMKRKAVESSSKPVHNVDTNPPAKHSDGTKHSDVKKFFEKLLNKVPVVTTPKLSHTLSNSGSKSNSQKTTRMLQAYYNGNQAPLRSALSPADSRLNSTFTKDSAHTPSVEKAPVTSYQMTPADSDPLIRCNNYDIADLSASDSTDDDEDPKKVLPLWALPDSLDSMMKSQEDDLQHDRVDITAIFPPEQLLRDPDLGKIFRKKRQRFYERSSSAHWNSPMYKKSRIISPSD